jgi:hypothetical protein
MDTGVKRAIVAVLALGSLAAAFFVKPLPQDPAYHHFADQRTLLGIPNFMDVASNLPFFGVGLAGVYNVLRRRDVYYPVPEARSAWLILGIAIFLTGIGSSFYHRVPNDSSLFGDRLPMAIGFSAVLGLMLWERVDRTLGARLWAPLVLAGVGSLLYGQAQNDFRFYYLLQGWAVLLVPVILLLFPAPWSGTGWLWLGLGLYALAKVFEGLDAPIYRTVGVVSGHSLKHVAAAAGSWFLFVHLIRRRPA